MPLYSYRAVAPDGRMVLGRIDALNIVDLELRLRRMELDLIDGEPVSNRSLFRPVSVPRREIIHFCFHLELLIRAGVPILEGLSDLRDSLEHPRFREVVASLIESIEARTILNELAAATCDEKGGICAFNGTGNSSRTLVAALGFVPVRAGMVCVGVARRPAPVWQAQNGDRATAVYGRRHTVSSATQPRGGDEIHHFVVRYAEAQERVDRRVEFGTDDQRNETDGVGVAHGRPSITRGKCL